MPGRRIASVGVWSPAGSAREARPQAGIAHLLEHMLFKGTKRRSAFEIAAVLDAVGGDLNAFTDREHSCYHCTLLGEHLPRAVVVLEAHQGLGVSIAGEDGARRDRRLWGQPRGRRA